MSGARPMRFFLGGHDLEMREIAALLHRHAAGRVEDLGLRWGARASAYQAAIGAALGRGETPVLIELEDDLPQCGFDRAAMIIVDHHGPLAGSNRPTSIEQIWMLLGFAADALPRRLALVAANDRAHVAGLIATGASAEEIAGIRADDRRSQGVTAEDEAEAERAIAVRWVEGRLTIVCTHSRTSSAIADRMLPIVGGPGYDRLLVVMPDKLAVFGDGAAIQALAEAYPASWWGGDLPSNGFWGASRSAEIETVMALIRE